ncbi:hypothetical protein E2562_037130 [Oryza meyeriana var. granulata]|uniref:HMA domain-containing protein n=1 Tax=Oryza meyeriana var. granulata TaxID=110450 RepID=A0A6G1F1X5_9ORYZ|nr:hypothetical protein E2562_037130 [Oryza meyeriana var. granulata]
MYTSKQEPMRGCWTSTTAVATAIVPATKKYDNAGAGDDASTSSPPLTVLEIELHCWGCAKKVRKLVMDFRGVSKVTMDIPANRVMVAGSFDAESLALSFRVRSKKAVTIISAPGRPLTADGQ